MAAASWDDIGVSPRRGRPPGLHAWPGFVVLRPLRRLTEELGVLGVGLSNLVAAFGVEGSLLDGVVFVFVSCVGRLPGDPLVDFVARECSRW